MQDDEVPQNATEASEQGAPGVNVSVPNAVYKIHSNLDNSMIVDMSLTESSASTHNVKLYSNSSATESTWKFYSIQVTRDLSMYLITNGRNNLALGKSPYYEDEENAIASRNDWRSSQLWLLKDAGGGSVYLENQWASDVLDVRGGSTSNNTNIIVYPYGGSSNQRFKLAYVRDL